MWVCQNKKDLSFSCRGGLNPPENGLRVCLRADSICPYGKYDSCLSVLTHPHNGFNLLLSGTQWNQPFAMPGEETFLNKINRFGRILRKLNIPKRASGRGTLYHVVKLR